MKIRIAIAIAACLMMSGCAAPMIWDKPGGTQAQYNLDSYDCERDTRAGAASFGGGIAGAMDARAFFQRCMEAHGYTLRQG